MFRRLRNTIWHYPDYVFFGRNSFFGVVIEGYKKLAPVSSFILVTVLTAVAFILSIELRDRIFDGNSAHIIEGIVMPVDANGAIRQLNKVSPLTASTNKTRLEKDLIELIYEGLIIVNQKGEPEPVLADFLEVEKGRKYQFKLKENVYWHDGVKVTSDDVEATYELLKKLDSNPQTSTIYSKAATKMDFFKSVDDPLSFEFVIRGNNVIPGFFETLTYKILPAHLLSDVTPDNIDLEDPQINRLPVGTGPYKLYGKNQYYIELESFKDYHGNLPKISYIQFKYFADEVSAIKALESGQIHALASVPTNYIESLESKPNLKITKTNVFYNQYYALYMNLSGAEENKSPVLDLNVRKAMELAIDKNQIVDEILNGYAEVAYGTIPPISIHYNNYVEKKLNKDLAIQTLEKAGWVIDSGTGFRNKSGTKLSITLTYLNNPIRENIVKQIKADLESVGIEVLLEKNTVEEINSAIYTKRFDVLLYGTQTLIDPDRYELFHSSQINNLNITGWKSSKLTGIAVDGKIQRIPESDDLLDTARRIVDEEERTKKYKDFQKLIANETPVIFLYYPVDNYVYNSRLENVIMNNLNSISGRFRTIAEWELKI